jgi:hypothetical protein
MICQPCLIRFYINRLTFDYYLLIILGPTTSSTVVQYIFDFEGTQVGSVTKSRSNRNINRPHGKNAFANLLNVTVGTTSNVNITLC